MTTVRVCPDRDIECGNNPKSWCDKCPQHDPDEEPQWAFKNPATPGDLKIGDYVFASRWSDSDPGDPWAVGYVDALGHNWISLVGNSRRWLRASRITKEQGTRILAEYPKMENYRGGVPYEFIRSIFNPRDCTNCGISGIHACLGVSIPDWSQNSISELGRVLSQYPAIPIKMPPLTEEQRAAIVSQFQQAEFDPLGSGVTHNAVQIDPRISAFEAIKAALDDPNQDGVLAKIRRIASLKD